MPDSKITFSKKPNAGEPWDVVVVGSGPAGLTAGIYTTRGAASTLILAGESWGGQLMLTTDVDNFPGFPNGIKGPDLMNAMRAQVERFGAEFLQESATEIDFTKEPKELKTTSGKTYFAKTIIITTGAETKWLGVPGEDKLRGRGISSCAPCDAPFFKDKRVIVVGGGDAAMEEALVLTKYTKDVTIVHRRKEFKASAAMQTRVFNEEKNGKIKILWSKEVTEFLGENKLEKVILKDSESGATSEMPIDGVFVAIGHTPTTSIYKGIDLDEKGYVRKNEDEGFHTLTNVKGVFTAGDVHDFHYKQAITAAGFGCMAGLDALKYLDKNTPSW
jgi:thioredoxin reductase (NADPH)